MYDYVSILMAYQPDHGPRDRIFRWVKEFYRQTMPGIEICVGLPTSELFSKAQGINQAANQATRDIFVIADGDVIFDPANILEAIQSLEKHPWLVPFHHHKIINLSKQNTEEVLESQPKLPLLAKIRGYKTERQFRMFAGKLIVISRKNFTRVGGFDERFIGWGCEDTAFSLAVCTMCGPMKRLDRMLFHLWHPPAETNHLFSKRNFGLLDLYYQAYRNQEKMGQLIRGGR